MTDDADKDLDRLRKQLRKAVRRGDAARVEALKAEYAALKATVVRRQHEEQRAAHLAARRAQKAQQQPREAGRAERWRLPFTRSPGARERDRLPASAEPVRGPVTGLRPWRRGGHPMAEQIWRPGG